MTTEVAWELVASPEVVPQLRKQVRDTLLSWDRAALADDAELVVSELLSNVVLHAPGRALVTLAEDGTGFLLQVADDGVNMPAPRVATESGTTGRGLRLVTQLTESWGFAPRDDGRPGKVVWARFDAEPRDDESLMDVDALLAAFEDPADVGFEVTVGEAPVELVAAAKDHLDGLLRELALAEGTDGGALPREVVDGLTVAVARFAEARSQLRRQLTRAQSEGRRRLLIRFSLPAELADAGEAYLAALAEMDAHARDRRMLSLASPPAYRVLREWYVRTLVEGLRRAADGQPPLEPGGFEERLLQEVETQEARARRSELAAQLQQATSRLAAADTLEQIAEISVAEGMTALGASGGTLTRPEGGRAVAVVQAGVDRGLSDRYDRDASTPLGPASDALRTQAPVFVGGPDERDARYPHVRRMQPDVQAIAAVPLSVVGEAVGALRFTWNGPRLFTEDERSYLEGLAAQTAQAVARANALEALREAESRSRALALLGERLASDRNVEALTEAVVDAVVPQLGDWAIVHLLDARGRPYFALSRHCDPDHDAVLGDLFSRFEVTLDQPYGAGYVIATGETQALPEITEDMLRVLGDDEFVAGVVASGVRSGLVVPLVARGRVVGALSVGSIGDPLTEERVRTVEDVGRRAGTALDNARALSTSVRLDLALAAANVGSFEMRLPGGELDWDDRLFQMLDIDPTTFDGSLESFFARVFPDDAARVGTAIDAAISSVGELAVEYRVLLQDGTVRWLEGRGRALPGQDGTAERLVGVVVDVTATRDASTRARRTLELMADGFLQLDPDWTVVYANAQAEVLIRRPRSELVGTSFWVLFPEAVGSVFERSYREAVATGQPARFEAVFDPLATPFEVRAFPGPDGLSIYFTDVGERRATEQQRDSALERLRLLNDVGAELTATLDVDEALTRLARRMLPVLADLVTIDLADDDVLGGRGVTVLATDPAKAAAMSRAEDELPRRNNPRSAVHQVLQGEPKVNLEIVPGHLHGVAVDPGQLEAYLSIDMRAALVVPLTARGRVFGALSLIRTGPDAQRYTAEEEQLAVELGRRAGLIVDNAAQYDAQRRVAEGLQRSLLPELPTVPGLRLGASYEPSMTAAKVGGDWYDAFLLPDGAVGLVIGDVMGHDIAAAAAMGQLRSVLRTVAVDGDEPEQVVDRLDRLVTTFAMADLATVVYARLRRLPDGSGELSWSNAGHPPPLLVVPGQPARYLEGGRSTMLGIQLGAPREAAVEVLPPGSTLLMFTDGLVERRDADLDARLETTRATAESLVFSDPDDLCRQLLDAVRRGGSSDDVALVALTLD